MPARRSQEAASCAERCLASTTKTGASSRMPTTAATRDMARCRTNAATGRAGPRFAGTALLARHVGRVREQRLQVIALLCRRVAAHAQLPPLVRRRVGIRVRELEAEPRQRLAVVE